MALLTFNQFINESHEENESRIRAKYQNEEGTIEAIDFTSAANNDLIEFLYKGSKKMVPRHDLTILD